MVSIDKKVKIISNINMIFAPIIGSIFIIVFKYIVFMFDMNIYLKTLITILISSVIYFAILVVLKNDFAINFIYPILRKLSIKIDE